MFLEIFGPNVLIVKVCSSIFIYYIVQNWGWQPKPDWADTTEFELKFVFVAFRKIKFS